jgi:hypothetical protein
MSLLPRTPGRGCVFPRTGQVNGVNPPRSTPDGAYRQAQADPYPRQVPQTDILITCANCGRPGREPDAEELGWRFYSDGVGELLPFCGLCAHRAFHPDAPASTDD